MSNDTMKINVRIWRQSGPEAKGRLVDYQVEGVRIEMSFLKMLDLMNEQLIAEGEEPVECDSDCREGICGTCGLNIQGLAHGPRGATARFRKGRRVNHLPRVRAIVRGA